MPKNEGARAALEAIAQMAQQALGKKLAAKARPPQAPRPESDDDEMREALRGME